MSCYAAFLVVAILNKNVMTELLKCLLVRSVSLSDYQHFLYERFFLWTFFTYELLTGRNRLTETADYLSV